MLQDNQNQSNLIVSICPELAGKIIAQRLLIPSIKLPTILDDETKEPSEQAQISRYIHTTLTIDCHQDTNFPLQV